MRFVSYFSCSSSLNTPSFFPIAIAKESHAIPLAVIRLPLTTISSVTQSPEVKFFCQDSGSSPV